MKDPNDFDFEDALNEVSTSGSYDSVNADAGGVNGLFENTRLTASGQLAAAAAIPIPRSNEDDCSGRLTDRYD